MPRINCRFHTAIDPCWLQIHSPQADIETLRQQVFDHEVAFAQTMADRDFEAFQKLLA